MSLRVALVGLLALACSDPGDRLRPRIQVPDVDSDAYPYAAVDTLELSIARAGSTEALALVSADIDQALQLDGVPYGDDLVVHLSGRAGGAEVAYGRTCVVDVNIATSTLEPFLYFSRLVRWGAGPDLEVPRGRGLRALSLGALTVAIGGGGGAKVGVLDVGGVDGALSTSLAGEVEEREGGTLDAFGKGALIVGGVDAAGAPLPVIELIDPREENVGNQVLALDGPALEQHASAGLEDGSILVSGGRVADRSLSASAYRFSVLGGEVVTRELQPGLLTPRYGHSMTRLGNEVGADVLIVGGLDAAGQPIAQAELFRPLRSAFESVDSALLITPRYHHQAVRFPGGFVLVLGGMTLDAGGESVPVRELELYDPVQGVFTPAGTLPSAAGVVDFSVTVLPDGRVMLAGGLDIDGQAVATVLIARFDAIDGVVDLSPSDPMESPRHQHSAVSLCDGTILVAGGTETPSEATERYSPPSEGRR